MDADDELRAIEESRSKDIQAWRRDLIICVTLTVPMILIMLFWSPSSSMTSADNSTSGAAISATASFGNVELQVWLMWLLATPVQFFVGQRFYKKAYYGLKAGCSMGMDFLVASGTTCA